MNHAIFSPNKYFPQCHASTLAQYKDGKIYAAWFAGTKEANPDTAIWMSYLELDKAVWAPPFVIAKVSDVAHWNPVLFIAPNSNMYLFFKVGSLISNWITYYKVFDGTSWTEPKQLVRNSMNRGPVRSKPIVLSNGTWIAPTSIEKTLGTPSIFKKQDVVWKAFVDVSKDNGKTWKKSDVIDFDRHIHGIGGKFGGVIQGTMWESGEGNAHMLLRSTAGSIFRTDTSNYGDSWSEAYPISLPNNNSGIDVARLNKVIFLVYNPVSGNWAARTPLSISVSDDNGSTWSAPVNIASGEGSFSYPSIVVLQDQSLGITYTWNRVSIVFVKIKLS